MGFLKDFKDLKKEAVASIPEEVKKAEPADVVQQEIPVQSEPEQKNTQQTEGKKMSEEANYNITVISDKTVINGDIQSDGAVSVYGTVYGNVTSNSKLLVAGRVSGNVQADEIFINKAAIDGEVVSNGNLKIGSGSIIIGDIYGQTAVIGGAVKGEVDIKGPVIIDSTAVIKGNIKSRSVQINNGAVIEGYCSQCYHETDVNSIFAEAFHEEAEQPMTEESFQEAAASDFEQEASVMADMLQQTTEDIADFEMPEEIMMPDVEATTDKVSSEEADITIDNIQDLY